MVPSPYLEQRSLYQKTLFRRTVRTTFFIKSSKPLGFKQLGIVAAGAPRNKQKTLFLLVSLNVMLARSLPAKALLFAARKTALPPSARYVTVYTCPGTGGYSPATSCRASPGP
jgi:hypothetical protein